MNKIHLDSREPKDVQEDCKKTFGKENVVVEFMLIGDLIFPKENLCIERLVTKDVAKPLVLNTTGV